MSDIDINFGNTPPEYHSLIREELEKVRQRTVDSVTDLYSSLRNLKQSGTDFKVYVKNPISKLELSLHYNFEGKIFNTNVVMSPRPMKIFDTIYVLEPPGQKTISHSNYEQVTEEDNYDQDCGLCDDYCDCYEETSYYVPAGDSTYLMQFPHILYTFDFKTKMSHYMSAPSTVASPTHLSFYSHSLEKLVLSYDFKSLFFSSGVDPNTGKATVVDPTLPNCSGSNPCTSAKRLRSSFPEFYELFWSEFFSPEIPSGGIDKFVDWLANSTGDFTIVNKQPEFADDFCYTDYNHSFFSYVENSGEAILSTYDKYIEASNQNVFNLPEELLFTA